MSGKRRKNSGNSTIAPTLRSVTAPPAEAELPPVAAPPVEPTPASVSTPTLSWLWTLVLGGVIVAALVAVYRNSFVGILVFDDLSSILDNPSITDWPPKLRVLLPPREGQTVSGRPMLNVSLMFNYAFDGPKTWGYHLVNLIIHCSNALLLFFILRRTFLMPALRPWLGSAATGLAWVIALLWSLHPMQTESVTYIVQRAESLGGLCYLGTLYCFLRGVESSRSQRWYLAAVLICVVGAGVKEIVATSPMLVFLYDRLFVGGSFREVLRRRWGLYLGLMLNWFVTVALVITTGLLERRDELGVTFTPYTYALTQPGVILNYLRLSVWPSRQCLDYEWPAVESIGEVIPGAIVLLLLMAGTAWGLTRGRVWGFAGIWFFLILSPSSSIVPLRQCAFEHRMYLPLAAVFSTLVVGGYLGLSWLVRNKRLPLGITVAASALVVLTAAVGFGVATIQRNEVFASEELVWKDTVEKAWHNSRAHSNFGAVLTLQGRLDEAVEHYQEAIRYNPNSNEAHTNLGVTFTNLGKLQEAIVHCSKAVEIGKDKAPAHNNWGNALLAMGKPEEALEHYQAASEIMPDFALALNNQGYVLTVLGRPAEAIPYLKRAVELKKDYGVAFINLGNALLSLDRDDEAVQCFREALKINPTMTKAHFNLAIAAARAGNAKEAVELANTAAQSMLDQPLVTRGYAWLLATAPTEDGGNPRRAVEMAERACKQTGQRDAYCLDTLAVAYAAAGLFENAVDIATTAHRLALAEDMPTFAAEIDRRREFFRQRKPWRELAIPPPKRETTAAEPAKAE